MYHQSDSSWTDFCHFFPGCLPFYMCIFLNVCMYVLCLDLQCSEGPMQGYCPSLLSWDGESGGCSGSLWQWSWGVRVCPGQRTLPPLPPPPHAPHWWTTQKRKWMNHALTLARVKSKKGCCMCTVMGGASLMAARYYPCYSACVHVERHHTLLPFSSLSLRFS